MSAHEKHDSLHHYTARLIWEGGANGGTSSYTSYGRQYRIAIGGKPDLAGTADPMFRGDAGRHNPEDLFVAAIALHEQAHAMCFIANSCSVPIRHEPTVTGGRA